MKTIAALLLILLANTASSQVVTGLYTGTLYNDSARMTQRYEIALSEYRGKITGYSYVTFVNKDTFYYGVRHVKAVREKDQLVVIEEKVIANNFPERPNKGVHRVLTIPLNEQEDTLRSMKGAWKTTATKVFRSVPGSLDLSYNSDSSSSSLIRHLKELNIITQPVYADASPVKKKEDKKEDKAAAKPAAVQTPVKPSAPASIPFAQRGRNPHPPVEVTADSIMLSIYDNGVVDGDTVSVYLDGQPVISQTRLTTSAVKKTLVLPVKDNVELLLVAENLGTLPPNTGLVVIKDGEKVHQLNFTADLQTNASIILKRKKK